MEFGGDENVFVCGFRGLAAARPEIVWVVRNFGVNFQLPKKTL
jgi:hypothetical protein